MLDCDLEEDDPIPTFKDCHQCGMSYEDQNGFWSNRNKKVEFCSEECAEEYDEEFEKEEIALIKPDPITNELLKMAQILEEKVLKMMAIPSKEL